LRVMIQITDPWDVGEELGWRALYGEVQRVCNDKEGGQALIKLDALVLRGGQPWSFLLAAPRHEGMTIAQVGHGKIVTASFLGVSDEKAWSHALLDVEDWRGGGLAFIGDLREVT